MIPGLTDALKFCNSLRSSARRHAHLRRRRSGAISGLQLRTVEQQRHLVDDVGHELRKKGLHLLHADLPEKTALLQPGHNQLGPGHQIISGASPDLTIDDQSVLEGKMADDPVGVLQDRVVTGQRRQDIGFDPDIVGYV